MKNLDPNTVIKVAIADDHAFFRTGVKTSLSARKDIQMVAEAENGISCSVSQTHSARCSFTRYPDADHGWTNYFARNQKAISKYKGDHVSMHNDHSMISRMMEIGANSYLTKDSDSETIYEAKNRYQQEFFFNDLTNKALLNGLRTKRTVESQYPSGCTADR